jgi:hypothetical protein
MVEGWWGGGVSSVEHLPCKHEALTANPSTAKNKQTNKQKNPSMVMTRNIK